MAKVSVIVITYNRSELVGTAIISVLNQTFQDFEIIVVDDASKDDTADVVQAFNDKRIRYIRHKTNKKEAGARNTGVMNSSSQYVGFLDDDDEWLSHKLKLQVDLLDNSSPKVGGVYTGSLRINKSTGETLGEVTPRKRGYIFNEMATDNWVGTPSTVLLRKECFERVGLFDEGIAFGPDYDMWIRISKEFEFEYIKEPLVKYYVHDVQLSTNYNAIAKGLEAQITKYATFFLLDTKTHSLRYLQLGVCYCYDGNVKKARKAFLKAIKVYPFEIRHYFNLCLSLLGASNFKKLKELKEKWLVPPHIA